MGQFNQCNGFDSPLGPPGFPQVGQHLRGDHRGLPAPPAGRYAGQVQGGGPGHSAEVVRHRPVLPPNHN